MAYDPTLPQSNILGSVDQIFILASPRTRFEAEFEGCLQPNAASSVIRGSICATHGSLRSELTMDDNKSPQRVDMGGGSVRKWGDRPAL